MSKFINNVSYKFASIEERDFLIKELEGMGYKHSSLIVDGEGYLLSYLDGEFTTCDEPHVIPSLDVTNPELFLALAAMRDGEDWVDGEWVWDGHRNIGSYQTFGLLKFSSEREYTIGFNLVGNWSNQFNIGVSRRNKSIVRKATAEELIKAFTDWHSRNAYKMAFGKTEQKKESHTGNTLPEPEVTETTIKFKSGHVAMTSDGQISFADGFQKTSISELEQIVETYKSKF